MIAFYRLSRRSRGKRRKRYGCIKTPFASRELAQAAMEKVEAADPQPGANVYPCCRCGSWHWGHRLDAAAASGENRVTDGTQA